MLKHRKNNTLPPLLPIQGSWLAAAMEARGLTVVQLVGALKRRKVRVARQTISYILDTERPQRTCRADVRRSLAKVLRVTESFLEGKPQGTGAWARTLDQSLASPVVALALMEFTQRCEAAWRRDVIATDPALDKVPVSHDPRSPWARYLMRDSALGFALYDLANPDVWRRWFLTTAPAATPAERETAMRHIVAALDVILARWFDGRTTLNTKALTEWWGTAATQRVTPTTTPTTTPPKRGTPRRKS